MGIKCDGCEDEMEMCFYYQKQKGIVAGLDWYIRDDENLHCFVFAIDEKTGEFICS